ncbi:MAG TPA: TolC family outer membrane protein [Hyphomicrobiaceae bacterium]|nr:TolC family outer membrane protein [Hyphomicrobiaceae bacterium]
MTRAIDERTGIPVCQQRRAASGLRYGVAAVAIAVAVCMSSAPALSDTLNSALSHAYRYNPKLDAARATLRATDEEVARANSGYRPIISGSADVGFQKQDTVPSGAGNGETHPRGYSVQAVQPLFRGGRVFNQVNEAEATVRAGREILRGVEQTVLLDATTAFMDVIRDQAVVRIRENNVEVLSKELRATRDRFGVGEVTRTDVAQAEARRSVSLSALEAARAALKTSRGAFERHIGHPPGRLVEPKLNGRVPKSLQEAISISSRENPFVIAALYREQSARHTVDRIWGELLPSMQLETTYSHRFDPSQALQESRTTSIVGRLTVPLYSGGEVDARVRQAKHTHVSRIQEIEQNRQEVQANVVAAWSQYQAAQAQLQSDTAQVRAFRTALNGVREEEKVGQRTLLDVLNAEQELLNAEVALVTTRRNIVVAGHALLAAIGRLNIQEIGSADTVYDPEVHYHEVRRQWRGVSITKNDDRKVESIKDKWETKTVAPQRTDGWKPVK